MAWTNIPAFVLDKVFGYQSAEQLRLNDVALAAVPYIVKSKTTPLSDFLSAAQPLDALASGYVKNTTGTGVLTTVPTVPVADLPPSLRVQTLQFVISHVDSPGTSIVTGRAGFIVVPWDCTITQMTILSSDPAVTSGSIVVDIWKDSYANYPPTVTDSICGSAKPTLSSAIKNQDSTLTGWSKTLVAGDIIGLNVDSVSAVTRVRLELRVQLA